MPRPDAAAQRREPDAPARTRSAGRIEQRCRRGAAISGPIQRIEAGLDDLAAHLTHRGTGGDETRRATG